MGLTSSKLEKALGPTFPESEHFFGLANFGNTCYCNSVLQALYFCIPFRKRVLEYYVAKQAEIEANRDDIDATNLLECLAELFWQISSQKKRTGSLPPRKFVQKLRKENELFNSYMHQDAHEFLIYVINEISEILQKEKHQQLEKERKLSKSNEPVPNMRNIKTFVHEVFEGTLTNETKCLTCETVTSRDEIFFDLSVDVEQNTSVTSCLRNFSYTETLGGEDKFFCDTCCSLQEAKKSMKVKKLPHVLALHLKRFKYMEHLQRHKKLHYRVAFPFELKLVNTSDDAADTEREYELFAVVIHVGSGPNHGHYVSMIKSSNHWLLFDDDNVELISEKHIPSVFGYPTDNVGTSDTGYILFYQTRSSDGNEPSTPSTNNSYATATTTTMTPRMMMPNNNSNNVTTKNSSSSVARTSTAAAAEDNNDVINVDDLDTALHSEGEDEDEDEDNGGPSPSSSNSNSNHRRRSGSHHQHQRSHDADMHFDNMEDIHHTTTITTNNYNNNNSSNNSNSVGGRGQR